MRSLSSLILPVVLLFASLTHAQNGRTVTLITIGPGDVVYEQFGHNILCISDDKTGEALYFDWGRFDFDEPGFIPRFVQGKMLYKMGAADEKIMSITLDAYARQGRQIVFQRLPLSDEQIRDLFNRCRIHYQPENRKYRYDYFTDNCSTRVRDMLDAATDGEIRRTLDAQPTLVPMTYRQHAMRLMQSDLLLSLGVDFVLGPSCDRVLSAWEESFLPTRFAAYVMPLAQETRVSGSSRPPEPSAPPDRRAALAMTGAVAGALIATLALSRRKWLVRSARTLIVLWWVLGAIGAVFMLYLWCFTDHTAGYANQNLLHFSPVAIFLLLLPVFRRLRRLDARSIDKPRRILAVAALAISALGLLLNLTGVLTQANLGFILLALPLHAAAVFGVVRLTAGRSPDQVSVP